LNASSRPTPAHSNSIAPNRISASATSSAAPLADHSADLITVAQALHWFDLDAFASEAVRVLKPGGILAVWSYEMAQIQPDTDAIVEHFYRDIVGPWWPPERAMVERGYADIQLPFTELDTPAFSMRADWTLGACPRMGTVASGRGAEPDSVQK
jgi:ubiquinone/menaquinone biosynthesis C-methylase UbiE